MTVCNPPGNDHCPRLTKLGKWSPVSLFCIIPPVHPQSPDRCLRLSTPAAASRKSGAVPILGTSCLKDKTTPASLRKQDKLTPRQLIPTSTYCQLTKRVENSSTPPVIRRSWPSELSLSIHISPWFGTTIVRLSSGFPCCIISGGNSAVDRLPTASSSDRMAKNDGEEPVVPTHSSVLHPPVRLQVANMQTDQKTNDSSASSQDGLASTDGLPASLPSDITAQPPDRLSITDLPDELLLNIFENATYSADIRNIRLTCRQFCSTSSHLLLDCLDVCLTAASLARFREISCHPTISRGIRVFHISLQSHCLLERDSDLLIMAILNLRGNINWVATNSQKALESGNFSSAAELQSILSERKRLLKCLTLMERTKRTSYSAHQQSLHRDVFRRVYEKNQKAWEWQQNTIEDETFAQEIAAAVRRMPRPIKLLFTDKYRYRARWPTCCTMLWMNHTSIADIFDEEIMMCMSKGFRFPRGNPTQLAVQVPLAIHAAGSSTIDQGVQFFYWPMRIDAHGQNQVSCLKVAAESLKVFTFEDRTNRLSNPRTLLAFSTYLGVVLGAGNVEALKISLQPMQVSYFSLQPERGRIGSLLASLRWPYLREVNLTRIQFHLTDLKSFIEKLRPEACVALKYPRLLSGTWAEGLDLLRARANAESWVYSLTGAECDSIPSHQRRRIFNGEQASWANQYVQGAPIRNPFLVTEDETGDEGMDTGPI